MTGTVFTFYSYKGGVGRTFALANTAAVLTRWGYRILCVDWDLDAPGLTHYLRPWLTNRPAGGVIDLVADHAAGRDPDPATYTVHVALPDFEGRPDSAGRLDLIAAGAEDDRYVGRAQEMDWASLYADHDLGRFLERCRARWTDAYDVVLIDSRTGITDIGGICTAQLPDVLVLMFTANEQSLRGTLDVARRAWEAHDRLPHDRGGLLTVPVPSRFDAREEYKRAEGWQIRFVRELAPLVEPWASRELPMERLIGHITVPYVSYWSFGEELPAVVEPEPTPDRIGYALETLAALVALRLDRTGLLAESRDSYIAAAARAGRPAAASFDVFLSYGPEQQELAARLARALRGRRLRVFLADDTTASVASSASDIETGIASSAHLVVLVDRVELDPWQRREVERFLRKTLDENTVGLVFPVLTPGTRRRTLPWILAQYQAQQLRDTGYDAVDALAATIVRGVSRGPAPARTTDGDALRDEALETLTELAGWELDPLRWQLVDDGVHAVERAVADRDDVELRAVTADLELLGPVRAALTRGREAVAMPAELRERVTALIERLGGQLDVAGARDAVTARLEHLNAGDVDAVLGTRPLTDAARYLALAGADDVEAAYRVGLMYQLRSRVRAERGEDGAADHAAAVRRFATVFRRAPDAVPADLRDDVSRVVEAGPAERAAWAGRVAELVDQARTSPDRDTLDDVVWVADLAVDRSPDDPEERAGHRVNLVLALRARFRCTADLDDVDRAVDTGRQAVADDGRPRSWTATALALVDRYEALGTIRDLDEAIELLGVAVDATGPDEPAAADSRSSLAAALATRFAVRGELRDLDRAIALLGQAVDTTAPTVERAGYLANLGEALFTRYRHVGDHDDLDAAVRCDRRAVDDLPPDHPDRVAALSGLGLALRARFQRTGDDDDLDDAVSVLDVALARAPGATERACIASNLSSVLRVRADTDREPSDADRAVVLARAAVSETAGDDARLPQYLSGLGAALAVRHRLGGSVQDLVDAAEVCTGATERLDRTDPARAPVYVNLGLALRRLFATTDDVAYLRRASSAYQASAETVTAAPLTRAIAAQEWADSLVELGEGREAIDAFALALDLLAQVTDRRLAPEDQQWGLSRLGGLASAAAATALDMGEPERALALLEQGRGVLVAQALGPAGEASGLRAAHPDLADRFDTLRRRLNDPGQRGRRQLVREWDDALDEIRTLPGFARFLRAPDVSELLDTVGAGPLVAVNVSARWCDALIVADGVVTWVPLPSLTYDEAHTRAAAFLAAIHGDDLDRDEVVTATLGWMWETMVEPVLESLERSSVDLDELDPGARRSARVWWMPTGPLAVLPLGAAGRGGRSALDHVVSSTVATIQSLGHVRRGERPTEPETLVVAVPRTRARPDIPDLTAVESEASDVVATVSSGHLVVGAEATVPAVGQLLPRYTDAHFACHAVADLDDPSRSGLLLADETLTVRAIRAVEMPRAGLAYLSACSTEFGSGTLLDEAIPVASAFQIAGYRDVVATMWPVGDLAARRLARLTYAAINDGADAAEAVHRTVVQTRRMLPDRPTVWAAHVHIGG